MKLYCLGPKGTNGHEAALRVKPMLRTGIDTTIEFCDRNEEILLRAAEDQCCGVVPIENSTAGLVSEVVRYWLNLNLFKRKLWAVGEIQLPIEHHLLVQQNIHDSSELNFVYSHPQAIAQCSKRLTQLNLQNRTVPEKSTANAAEHVSINADVPARVAALASRLAAETYGLKILVENMQDSSDNATRFHVVGPWMPRQSGCDRTAMIFMPIESEKSGVLANALWAIAASHVNMSSIHSIPLGQPGKYGFYCEFDCHVESDEGVRIVRRLETLTEKIIVLGSYPRTISNSTKKEA
jgi:prephenate dehydratase